MARPLPPLNALRTFECAGRCVSFVQAAEELNVTPGAVSRQVKALEEWLGARLFRRQHKQVTLTTTGRTYLEAIGVPLEQIASATDRVRRQDSTRALALCCYPTFALRWLVPRWPRFYDKHPEIDVQLTTSLQPVDFARDDFDAAVLVGKGPASWPGMEAMRLVEVDVMPVCSPALLQGAKPLRRPQDLGHQTLLHSAPRPGDWHRWLELVDCPAVDPDTGVTFDSLNLSIQAAIEGLGVAIAVRALIEGDLATGRLHQPFEPIRRSDSPFHLVYPPYRARAPQLRAFIDWLREEVGSR